MELSGLKKYSHKQREKIIKEVSFKFRRKFGKNLRAIAIEGSFVRGEDLDYSDIELIVFVKKKPRKEIDFIRIKNGIKVEALYMEEQEYIKDTLEITGNWPYSGADKLKAVINPKPIAKLNKFKPKNKRARCWKLAAQEFKCETQENYGKLFNAIISKNRDAIPLLFFETLKNTLEVLSFLNAIPFVTYSKFVQTAKKFKIKPDGLDELLKISRRGNYQNLEKLSKVCAKVYNGMNKLFEERGFELYDDNIDPLDRNKILKNGKLIILE
ncbi:MAG: hypothetical protein KAW16_06515 [candidate division Zixibacteria bacterium]|nr:hypothetical protein [candidate division Zixibacteria bacterium]